MGCDLHKKDELKMKEYNKTRNTIFDNEGYGNVYDILHHECSRARAAGMLDKAIDYIRRYINEIVPGFEDKIPDNKEFMEEDATKKLIIFRNYIEDEVEEMRTKVMMAARRLNYNHNFDDIDFNAIYAADIEDEIHKEANVSELLDKIIDK